MDERLVYTACDILMIAITCYVGYRIIQKLSGAVKFIFEILFCLSIMLFLARLKGDIDFEIYDALKVAPKGYRAFGWLNDMYKAAVNGLEEVQEATQRD